MLWFKKKKPEEFYSPFDEYTLCNECEYVCGPNEYFRVCPECGSRNREEIISIMKLVKILHYVEKSYQDKPSFVLLMSDNKEYISNGCVFIENTDSHVKELIEEYDCKQYLDELFLSGSIEMKDIKDASCMFSNCSKLAQFNSDMSSVIDAWCMFSNCYNLINKPLRR